MVKGGVVLGAKFRRALTYNNKEISIDNQRPQLNGNKEFQNSNNINWIGRGARTFSMTKGTYS